MAKQQDILSQLFGNLNGQAALQAAQYGLPGGGSYWTQGGQQKGFLPKLMNALGYVGDFVSAVNNTPAGGVGLFPALGAVAGRYNVQRFNDAQQKLALMEQLQQQAARQQQAQMANALMSPYGVNVGDQYYGTIEDATKVAQQVGELRAAQERQGLISTGEYNPVAGALTTDALTKDYTGLVTGFLQGGATNQALQLAINAGKGDGTVDIWGNPVTPPPPPPPSTVVTDPKTGPQVDIGPYLPPAQQDQQGQSADPNAPPPAEGEGQAIQTGATTSRVGPLNIYTLAAQTPDAAKVLEAYGQGRQKLGDQLTYRVGMEGVNQRERDSQRDYSVGMTGAGIDRDRLTEQINQGYYRPGGAAGNPYAGLIALGQAYERQAQILNNQLGSVDKEIAALNAKGNPMKPAERKARLTQLQTAKAQILTQQKAIADSLSQITGQQRGSQQQAKQATQQAAQSRPQRKQQPSGRSSRGLGIK